MVLVPGTRTRFCEPHVLDPRSVASLRVLLSLYVLYDLFVSRLGCGSNVRFWLAWYASVPEEDSILDPEDTPHRAPLHRLWFHRGSVAAQLAWFSVTAALAVAFGLGVRCRAFGVVPCALWFCVVAVHGRAQSLCDGSDKYLSLILFWCAQLDTSRVWSLDDWRDRETNETTERTNDDDDDDDDDDDARDSSSSSTTMTSVSLSATNDHERRSSPSPLRRRNVGSSSTTSSVKDVDDDEKDESRDDDNNDNDYHDNNNPPVPFVRGPAALGLTLQIALMYLGTVHRRLVGTMWLWPELTAVYYALSHTFATRAFVAELARRHVPVTRLMTAGAMVAETCGPIACLLCPANGYRHAPASLVFALHLGLFATMRLPNWQLLAMAVCAVWTPSSAWDALASRRRRRRRASRTMTTSRPVVVVSSANDGRRRRRQWSARDAVSSFFLLYMVYNWAGERGWASKIDNGDLGEALRISQYWVMFSPDVGRRGFASFLTGTTADGRRVDLFRALRDDDWRAERDGAPFSRRDAPLATFDDPSSAYPSPRVERAITSWHKERRTFETRVRRLARFLCRYGSDRLASTSGGRGRGRAAVLTTIEFEVVGLTTTPPERRESRFVRDRGADESLAVRCDVDVDVDVDDAATPPRERPTIGP